MNDFIDFNASDFKMAIRALGVLNLKPAQKRKLTGRLGRAIRTLANKNIKAQRTIFATPFTERVKKYGHKAWERIKVEEKDSRERIRIRRKWIQVKIDDLEKNMARPAHLGVYVDPSSAKILYPNGRTGSIAYEQQWGAVFQIQNQFVRPAPPDLDMHKKQIALPSGKLGCTIKQAILLYRLGIKSRTGSLLSLDEIMAAFTVKQAAFLLHKLQESMPRKSVPSFLPPRPFLGANTKQATLLAQWVLKHLAEKVKKADALSIFEVYNDPIPF